MSSWQWLLPVTELLFLVVVGWFVVLPLTVGFWKGAPFVPTPWRAARKIAEAAAPRDGDVVLDPGCGDGRLLVACAERAQIRGVGYELFLPAYLLARLRSRRGGHHFTIRFADSTKTSWKDVDILVCYLLPDTMVRWKPKFLEMRPGARIVSYAFRIAGWEPVRVLEREPEKNIAPVWVYEIGRGTP